jgi:hypothetical protein
MSPNQLQKLVTEVDPPSRLVTEVWGHRAPITSQGPNRQLGFGIQPKQIGHAWRRVHDQWRLLSSKEAATEAMTSRFLFVFLWFEMALIRGVFSVLYCLNDTVYVANWQLARRPEREQERLRCEQFWGCTKSAVEEAIGSEQERPCLRAVEGAQLVNRANRDKGDAVHFTASSVAQGCT